MKPITYLLGLTLLTASPSLKAQDGNVTNNAATMAAATENDQPLESFDTLLDPTLFTSRVGLGYEGLQKHNGGFRNKFLLNGTYAFKTAAPNDTAVAFEQPIVHQNYTDDGTGMGDFKLIAGHIFKRDGVFRWGAGLETLFPTASNDQIGDGVVKLTPIFGWQTRVLSNVQFGGRLKYNYSVYEEEGRARANSIEFNPQLLAEWPHDIYTSVAWNSEWTLVNGGHYIGKFEPQIGKAFGKNNQWVAYVGVEIPWIHAGDDILTYKTGISYLFQ